MVSLIYRLYLMFPGFGMFESSRVKYHSNIPIQRRQKGNNCNQSGGTDYFYSPFKISKLLNVSSLSIKLPLAL
jgi:hypothetical protein